MPPHGVGPQPRQGIHHLCQQLLGSVIYNRPMTMQTNKSRDRAALLLLTQDHISASIVHEEHGLVVGLLLPALQHLVQVVNGPGPLHQLCPCLLKPTLHKRLFCQTTLGCLGGIHVQISAAVQCIALRVQSLQPGCIAVLRLHEPRSGV